MAGEGVPYLIDQYRVWTADNVWQARTRELPLDRMLHRLWISGRGINWLFDIWHLEHRQGSPLSRQAFMPPSSAAAWV